MSPSVRFRRVGTFGRGYDVKQVEAFMAKVARGGVSAAEVRGIGFDPKMGGYDPASVDAEMDRVEDALAIQERDGDRRGMGDQAFVQEITAQAQVLRSRLARPPGDRFAVGSIWERSYDIDDVDDLCDDIAEYFAGKRSLSAETLRSATFAPRRGSRGYKEPAVDRFINRVIAIMSKVS